MTSRVSASTALVKQHYLIDLPAGAAIALAASRVAFGRRAARGESKNHERPRGLPQ